MANELLDAIPSSSAPPAGGAGPVVAETTAAAQLTLTPALIREVTQKVYALWLHDLQIERERLGLRGNTQLTGWRNR